MYLYDKDSKKFRNYQVNIKKLWYKFFNPDEYTTKIIKK